MILKNRLLDLDKCIYQDDDAFKFSLDSVLLSKFVTINLRCKKIIDLATGNAPIPMFLTYRTKALIYGIEYQKSIFDMGVRSIRENNLNQQVSLVCGDVKEINQYFSSESFDTVVCNPPYFKINKDLRFLNDNKVKAIARHEVSLTLDDVVKSASFLLKNGGNFAMVHRTERLMEIIDVLKKYNIEPKRIQFIYPKVGMNSDLFLIEGIKNGKSGLKMLYPIIVHKDNDDYTDEMLEILNFNNLR